MTSLQHSDYTENKYIPGRMTDQEWAEYYRELIFIQGKRGLITPPEIWKKEIKNNNYSIKKNDTLECPICLQYLESKVAILSCNHLYHYGCICNWYITSNEKEMCENSRNFIKSTPHINCPICRKKSHISKISSTYPEWLYVKEDHLDQDNHNDELKQNSQNAYKKNSKCKNNQVMPECYMSNQEYRYLESRIKYLVNVFKKQHQIMNECMFRELEMMVERNERMNNQYYRRLANQQNRQNRQRNQTRRHRPGPQRVRLSFCTIL